MIKLWALVLVLSIGFLSMEAQAARRFGGGKSFGQQSSNVSRRDALPSAPPAPGGNSAGSTPSAPSQPALQNKPAPTVNPSAPPVVRRPWTGMLGGLAAGLGLAWLAHSLGVGEAFGQVLLIGLLALGAMALWGLFMRTRRSGYKTPSGHVMQGAAPGSAASPEVIKGYSPDHVGNDA